MATPGRRPKPTHLKIIEGNPGKRSLNMDAPQPEPVAPDIPDWLSDYAVEEWERVVPELDKLGLLGRIDRTALAVYCEAVSAHRKAVEVRTSMGERVLLPGGRGPDGEPRFVKNPIMQVIRDQATLVARMCAEFGMTPSARGRMVLPDDPEADLNDLL